MKKFLFCVMAIFCLTSCSWFDKPADVEIVGIGLVYNDDDVLVAEIDSTRYTPSYVYTATLDGKARIYPDQTLVVTAFKLNGDPKIEFIAGAVDEQYLKEYFSENDAGLFIFLAAIIILIVFLILSLHSKASLPSSKHKKQTSKAKKKG